MRCQAPCVSSALWCSYTHLLSDPFLQVPWQDLVYSLGEVFTEEELRRILATPRDTVARKRKLINFHLRDLSWTAPGSRVADNVLLKALRHCI